MTPNITALIRSTILTIWFTVALTIGGELSAPFKSFLTGVAGHHWTTKSIFIALAFVLFYAIFAKSKEVNDVARAVRMVLMSVVAGGLVILLFFVWHFFGA
jgi:hypothetical protein